MARWASGSWVRSQAVKAIQCEDAFAFGVLASQALALALGFSVQTLARRLLSRLVRRQGGGRHLGMEDQGAAIGPHHLFEPHGPHQAPGAAWPGAGANRRRIGTAIVIFLGGRVPAAADTAAATQATEDYPP